jgi:hypothetical protein
MYKSDLWLGVLIYREKLTQKTNLIRVEKYAKNGISKWYLITGIDI